MDDQVRIFISYAREDGALLQAFFKAFTDIGNIGGTTIGVFYDDLMEAGDDLRQRIKSELTEADHLVVLHTERQRDNYSWAGWEVGFFEGLIQKDAEDGCEPRRQLVSFYVDKTLAMYATTLQISIAINKDLFRLGRQAYLADVSSFSNEQKNADPVCRYLLDLHSLAQGRKTAGPAKPMVQFDQIEHILKRIYPDLKADIYDYLSSRITKRDLEQAGLRFEIPPMPADAPFTSLPESTLIRTRGLSKATNPFSGLFGLTEDDSAPITWAELRHRVDQLPEPNYTMLSGIETAIETAIKQNIDNNQIIRSHKTKELYRVIVTEQAEYYDGKRSVYIWLVPVLSQDDFGDPESMMIVNFITVASRFRFLFLLKSSVFSAEQMGSLETYQELRAALRMLMHELVLIEDQSEALNLNSPEAVMYIVQNQVPMEKVIEDSERYKLARKRLEDFVDKVLFPNGNIDEASLIEKWPEILQTFIAEGKNVNTVYMRAALANLAQSLDDDQ